MTALMLMPISALAQDDDQKTAPWMVDADVTCKSDDCPKLQHFHFGFRFEGMNRVSLQLGWDPGHVNKATWADTDDVLPYRLPPRKTWFDQYALRYRARPTVEVSLENWSGATLLPDASGLSFAHALQDSGWNQTVLRISMIDPDRPINSWSIIAGLGEGERFQDSDHKPYVAFMVRRQWAEGFEWQGALSYDPDSAEKDQFYWLPSADRKAASQGYQTDRQALSLILNGQHPRARGLRAALGWQRNHERGPGTPAMSSSEGPFELTELLGRDVVKQTLSFSASYLILAEYALAFHHQSLSVKMDEDVAIQSCSELDSEGACTSPGMPAHRLRLRESTFGLGRIDEDGWSLFLEFMRMRYDQLYDLYHFAPKRGKREPDYALTQVRLSWRW